MPPSWFLPGLEPALDAIVLKALAKQPGDRHAGARALADALRAVGPTGPVPPSLLVTAPADGAQKHSPDAPTLAVPNVVPRNADHPSGSRQGVDLSAENARRDEALAARPSPPATTRGSSPTQQGQGATFIVVAIVALAATFAAGFAAGRASSAPSAPAPTHVGH